MEGKIWCSSRHSAPPERILKRVHFKLTLGYISTHPIWQIWEDGFKFKLWSGGGGIITLWQQLLLWREMSTLQTCTLYTFNQIGSFVLNSGGSSSCLSSMLPFGHRPEMGPESEGDFKRETSFYFAPPLPFWDPSSNCDRFYSASLCIVVVLS